MSIAAAKRVIHRTEIQINELISKHQHNQFILNELTNLNDQLKNFIDYLNKIDQLTPNYNTNEINEHMQAITLHVDLLKERLPQKEFSKIQHRIRLLKTVLRFHPTKYGTLAFITAWLYEFLFFI